eukprot:Rhum_TRINITY_DN8611_c0_g1::Rhum_TRINITY_DN8611_c0_g1_i1::g.28987::m.28987
MWCDAVCILVAELQLERTGDENIDVVGCHVRRRRSLQEPDNAGKVQGKECVSPALQERNDNVHLQVWKPVALGQERVPQPGHHGKRELSHKEAVEVPERIVHRYHVALLQVLLQGRRHVLDERRQLLHLLLDARLVVGVVVLHVVQQAVHAPVRVRLYLAQQLFPRLALEHPDALVCRTRRAAQQVSLLDVLREEDVEEGDHQVVHALHVPGCRVPQRPDAEYARQGTLYQRVLEEGQLRSRPRHVLEDNLLLRLELGGGRGGDGVGKRRFVLVVLLPLLREVGAAPLLEGGHVPREQLPAQCSVPTRDALPAQLAEARVVVLTLVHLLARQVRLQPALLLAGHRPRQLLALVAVHADAPVRQPAAADAARRRLAARRRCRRRGAASSTRDKAAPRTQDVRHSS